MGRNGNGFAKTLTAEMKSQGVSIRGLARKLAGPEATHSQLEIQRRNLNRWIHEGIKPSPGNRAAVAVALGVSKETFADEDDEEDSELASDLYAAIQAILRAERERVA